RRRRCHPTDPQRQRHRTVFLGQQPRQRQPQRPRLPHQAPLRSRLLQNRPHRLIEQFPIIPPLHPPPTRLHRPLFLPVCPSVRLLPSPPATAAPPLHVLPIHRPSMPRAQRCPRLHPSLTPRRDTPPPSSSQTALPHRTSSSLANPLRATSPSP